MKTEYVAKIKAPKNCYFCKHLSEEMTDDEYTSTTYLVCNNPKEVKNSSGDNFEKNLKWHKRCFQPVEVISPNGLFSCGVKVVLK